MRELEMTGKTVEEAVQAACESLGVDRDDLNISYEVLEFPAKKLFKTIPARVKVTLTEPEPERKPAPAPERKPEPAAQQPKPAAAPVPEAKPAPEQPQKGAAEYAEEPITIEDNARLSAAVDYLKPIFALMGAENISFSAVKKGEATILKVEGDHVGALIGRRGETMESLSYLASLVINRMEGDYTKLGLDVSGYRGKREEDLSGLTARICEKVKRTGYYYEMEPMNPYERHIIHAAVGNIEGVRSESKGDGQDRRVVIYSTDPNASNLPDRDSGRRSAPRGPRPQRGPRNYGDNRAPRENRGPRPYGDQHGGKPYGDRSARPYPPRGPKTNVPGREFAETPRDAAAQPQVPSRTERIHDDDAFELFGKIDL